MMWPFRPTDHRILDLRRKLRGMTAIATQLRGEKSRLVDANQTLRRLVDIQTGARDSALSERDEARAQLAAKDELIARMDAELTEVSGRLADALERNALIDREEDMRDEVRAKRLSDGLGDD